MYLIIAYTMSEYERCCFQFERSAFVTQAYLSEPITEPINHYLIGL